MIEDIIFRIDFVGTKEQDQELSKINQTLKSIKDQEKQLNAAFKAGTITQKQYNQELSKLGKTSTVLSAEKNKLNNIIRQENKLLSSTAKTLGQVNAQLAIEKRRLLDIEIGSKAFDKQTAKIKKLESQVRSANGQMGRGTSFVGEYGKAFTTAAAKIGGVVLALRTVGRLLSGITKANTGFEQSLKDLGAITGATGKDLEFYAKKAKEFTFETNQSASEILEAFKLVGSAKPELLGNAEALAEVTRQAITLSEAGGIELTDAVDALTISLNQFGKNAGSAATFTDILATSQQKGTAPIKQLAEAMVNAGGTVRAFGGTFEDANVLIQGFASGGVLGAEAGTQLAGVLSKLAKVEQKEFNPQFTNSIDIIDNLSKANLTYTDLINLTDVRGAKWLTTLINQNEVLQRLKDNLNGVGSAQEQAAQRSDSLANAQGRFNNALQVVVTSEDGLKGVTKLLDRWRLKMDVLLDPQYTTLLERLFLSDTKLKELEIERGEAVKQKKDVAIEYGLIIDENAAKETKANTNEIIEIKQLTDEEKAEIEKRKKAKEKAIDEEIKRIDKAVKEENEARERGLAFFQKVEDDKLQDLNDSIDEENEARERGLAFFQKVEDDKTKDAEEEQKKRTENEAREIEARQILIGESIEATQQILLASIERRTNKEKELLQKQLDDQTITQEQFDEKTIELEKKQFEREKKIAIARALIEGALEIARINSNAGVNADLTQTLRILLTAAAVVRTTAQIATISTQQFATGGIVGDANIPEQSNGDNVFATLRTGEVVLNETQQRRLGGADTFKKIGVPGFIDGGLVQAPNIPAGLASGFDAEKLSLNIAKQMQAIKVIVTTRDIANGLKAEVVLNDNSKL
jgi:TP901 family phage tail tape measure protein